MVKKGPAFVVAIQETVIMVIWSSIISFVLGLFFGILLTVTKKGGVLEKPLLYEQYPDTYGKLDLNRIEEGARHTGWVILGGKSSTEFGIGASLAEVVRAVFHNEHRILPVSVCLDGEYGHRDTFCSVPCVLGSDGIESVIELELDEGEKAKLSASINTMNAGYALALAM